MAAVRMQYRLRGLLVFMTMVCLSTGTVARVVRFQQQARYHHGQVDRHMSEARRASRTPSSRGHWDAARRHLALACVCEYVSFHPWQSFAGAQEEVAQAQQREGDAPAEPQRESR